MFSVLKWAFFLWRNRKDKTFYQLSAFEYAFNVLAEQSLFKPVSVGNQLVQPGRVSENTMKVFVRSNIFHTEDKTIDHFLIPLANEEATEIDYDFANHKLVEMQLDKFVMEIICELDTTNKKPTYLFGV